MRADSSDSRLSSTKEREATRWHMHLEIPGYFGSPGWIDTAEAAHFVEQCRELLRDPAVKLLTFKPAFSEEWLQYRETLRQALPATTRGDEQVLTYPCRDTCIRVLSRRIGAASESGTFAMLEDITTLTLLFARITQSDQLFPSLCVLSGDDIDPQQGFIHADVPILTMLCTLSGATTEYTPPENVLGYHYQWIGRWPYWLKTYDLVDPQDFRSLSENTVALLKGERSGLDPREFVRSAFNEQGGESFNVDGGLVHRAPLLFPGERRIYFQAYTHQIPPFLRQAAPRAGSHE